MSDTLIAGIFVSVFIIGNALVSYFSWFEREKFRAWLLRINRYNPLFRSEDRNFWLMIYEWSYRLSSPTMIVAVIILVVLFILGSRS